MTNLAMIYPVSHLLHHQILKPIFLLQMIGHRITTESNLNTLICFSQNSRCLPRISTNYLISGKHLRSPSTVIHLSPVPQICTKQSTPPPMVVSNGRVLQFTIIWLMILLPMKLQLHGKLQNTTAGFMILTSSYGISSPIKALTRSLITHLTKNMISRVSISFTICFLAIGAGEKQ